MRSDAADQTNAPPSTRSPLTEYNSGTAAYKAGKFSQATQSFQNSINAAPTSDAQGLGQGQVVRIDPTEEGHAAERAVVLRALQVRHDRPCSWQVKQAGYSSAKGRSAPASVPAMRAPG